MEEDLKTELRKKRDAASLALFESLTSMEILTEWAVTVDERLNKAAERGEDSVSLMIMRKTDQVGHFVGFSDKTPTSRIHVEETGLFSKDALKLFSPLEKTMELNQVMLFLAEVDKWWQSRTTVPIKFYCTEPKVTTDRSTSGWCNGIRAPDYITKTTTVELRLEFDWSDGTEESPSKRSKN